MDWEGLEGRVCDVSKMMEKAEGWRLSYFLQGWNFGRRAGGGGIIVVLLIASLSSGKFAFCGRMRLEEF